MIFYYNVKERKNMELVDWGFSNAVVITGLVVVFAILILLVILCVMMGKVFQSVNNAKKVIHKIILLWQA